jgi:CRISPR-associated protein Csm2
MANFQQGPRHGGGRNQHERGPQIRVDDIKFSDKPDARLFSDIAEEKAREVANGSSREANKSSQLRRFYDELVMWQEKVGSSDERFEELHPYIAMLKAKVAYALGRKHVDENFSLLMITVVDQARDAKT